MKYPLGKLLKNFANMSRAEILVYLKNQEKELREKKKESELGMKTSVVRMGHVGEYSLIKEILGDSGKV